MSRFLLLFAAIALSACATAPATRAPVPIGSSAAPTVQVANIDDALAQFLGEGGADLILLPNRLDRSQLDYSMESLKLVDRWLADADLVTREEFDAAREMAQKAREENEALAARIAELEKKLS